MENYRIIALIGESGSGKDCLMQGVLSAAPNKFHEIISCTTRPPREGEIDGKNYFFLSDKEFAAKVQGGEMLEYTEFNNWHYGTMKESLSAEKVNIGVFNPAGICALIEHSDIELTIIRVCASAKERLLRQLNREENPDVDEIIRRYTADKNDFNIFSTYDFKNAIYLSLLNNNLEDYQSNVKQILTLSQTSER